MQYRIVEISPVTNLETSGQPYSRWSDCVETALWNFNRHVREGYAIALRVESDDGTGWQEEFSLSYTTPKVKPQAWEVRA